MEQKLLSLEEHLFLEMLDNEVLDKIMREPAIVQDAFASSEVRSRDCIGSPVFSPTDTDQEGSPQSPESLAGSLGSGSSGTSPPPTVSSSGRDWLSMVKQDEARFCLASVSEGDKCPVCEDGEVGKHVYYGGRSCHSCRGFFRRSVQSGHNHLFGCRTGAHNCLVLSKSRQSCQGCRYRRCLERAGLKPEQVLTGEQRRVRLIKRSMGKSKGSFSSMISGSAESFVVFQYV